jgi:hypothetical protein
MKRNIYFCENNIETKDQLPKGLIVKLQKRFPTINFLHFDPNEEFVKPEKDLVIIDTVYGIKEIRIFKNLQHLQLSPRVTMHDYDLSIHLGIMKKLGKINKIKIVAIPINITTNQIYKKLEFMISSNEI